MAKDTSPQPVKTLSASESAELAHLQFREKELKGKADKIKAHPETKEHDLTGAAERNAMLLKQVQDRIKKLSK